MNNLFTYSFIFIIVITIIVAIFSSPFIPLFDYSTYNIKEEEITISSNGYTWPLPR